MARRGRPPFKERDHVLVTFWLSDEARDAGRAPIMHAYGPYTRAQAEYRRRLEREAAEAELPYYGPGMLHVAACRTLDVDAMNASHEEEEEEMAKVAVHTRTKSAFIAKATELQKAGKAHTSYPRIVEKAGLTVAQLHAMYSTVTELKGGWTVMDTNHVKKLDAFLKADGALLAIIEKGAKKVEDVK